MAKNKWSCISCRYIQLESDNVIGYEMRNEGGIQLRDQICMVKQWTYILMVTSFPASHTNISCDLSMDHMHSMLSIDCGTGRCMVSCPCGCSMVGSGMGRTGCYSRVSRCGVGMPGMSCCSMTMRWGVDGLSMGCCGTMGCHASCHGMMRWSASCCRMTRWSESHLSLGICKWKLLAKITTQLH